MSVLVCGRVRETLVRLRLGHIAERLDALLSEAAKSEPTCLDFLDRLLTEEVASKQRKRVQMGIQVAHCPAVKTLDDFDFKFQPSVDQKLVREFATGRSIANAENVLLFGPPGVGKTHLAIALGRTAVETGASVRFVSATALIATLAKAESEGRLHATSSRSTRSRSCSSATSWATCRSSAAAHHHQPVADPGGDRGSATT